MKTDERHVDHIFGNSDGFKVPEGYFDQLITNVMTQVEAEAQTATAKPAAKPTTAKPAATASATPTKPIRKMLRPMFYAAASVLAAVFCGTLYFHHTSDATDLQPQETATVASADDTYIDEAADYLMVDNTDIYAYLADY